MKLESQQIGLIGLDALGEAIAGRLVDAGLRVVVWDMRAERRRAFVTSAKPALAPSLADLGGDCEIVLSTLPHAELRAAALGDADRDGFAPQLAPGSLIVDMGVAHPHESRVFAGLLGRGGIGLMDAPAIGDATAARTGTLVIPIGGYFEFVDRLTPLLTLLGSVQRSGGPGSGHAMAAARAYARFAATAAAREAMRVGMSLGLPPELMPDLAAAASEGVESDPRLSIAVSLAAEHGIPAPGSAPDSRR